jgi:hypothetical protein
LYRNLLYDIFALSHHTEMYNWSFKVYDKNIGCTLNGHNCTNFHFVIKFNSLVALRGGKNVVRCYKKHYILIH